jgi:hypothetical protein
MLEAKGERSWHGWHFSTIVCKDTAQVGTRTLWLKRDAWIDLSASEASDAGDGDGAAVDRDRFSLVVHVISVPLTSAAHPRTAQRSRRRGRRVQPPVSLRPDGHRSR